MAGTVVEAVVIKTASSVYDVESRQVPCVKMLPSFRRGNAVPKEDPSKGKPFNQADPSKDKAFNQAEPSKDKAFEQDVDVAHLVGVQIASPVNNTIEAFQEIDLKTLPGVTQQRPLRDMTFNPKCVFFVQLLMFAVVIAALVIGFLFGRSG